MSLPDKLRDAADAIEEANRRNGFNTGAPWSPRALRIEADHIEARDAES